MKPLPDIPAPLDRIVATFVADLAAPLGDELVGAYLLGSAVSGDFDPDLSDFDMVVVTRSKVDVLPRALFDRLVDDLAAREPDWAGRLDLTFIGQSTLHDFRDGGGPFLEISHEDGLQLIRRADEWTETWFLALDADRAVVGPPAAEVFPPISFEEFLHVMEIDVVRYASAVDLAWNDGKLAYRVLTLCRILRSQEQRSICSKLEGAGWAISRYPRWAVPIRAALEVRASNERRPYTTEERSGVPAVLAEMAAEVVRRAP